MCFETTSNLSLLNEFEYYAGEDCCKLRLSAEATSHNEQVLEGRTRKYFCCLKTFEHFEKLIKLNFYSKFMILRPTDFSMHVRLFEKKKQAN